MTLGLGGSQCPRRVHEGGPPTWLVAGIASADGLGRVPSVCAGGMAGQLGWECRLEWPNTTVHIHLSLPSRDWRVRCPIGLSGWPSDMPAGRTQRLPVVEGPPAGVDVSSLRVLVS